MKNHKLTFLGLLLALNFYFITHMFDLDLFEALVEILESLETFEVDELIIPLTIIFLFTFIDQYRRLNSQKVNYEKTKIYKAMMFSTHHILNNFLNNMQLFKITAEDTPEFDPEILSLYEVVIKDASTQIEALGNITDIDETSIHASIAPK